MTTTGKQFRNVSIPREQFRAVLAMQSPDSQAMMKSMTDDQLVRLQYRARKLLNEVTAGTEPGAAIPVVNIQYVKGERQVAARRWYREVLLQVVKFTREELLRREGVSSLLTELEAKAEPEIMQVPGPSLQEEIDDELVVVGV